MARFQDAEGHGDKNFRCIWSQRRRFVSSFLAFWGYFLSFAGKRTFSSGLSGAACSPSTLLPCGVGFIVTNSDSLWFSWFYSAADIIQWARSTQSKHSLSFLGARYRRGVGQQYRQFHGIAETEAPRCRHGHIQTVETDKCQRSRAGATAASVAVRSSSRAKVAAFWCRAEHS